MAILWKHSLPLAGLLPRTHPAAGLLGGDAQLHAAGSFAFAFSPDRLPDPRRIAPEVLGALEARAAEHGASAVRLDTNRALGEAITMYRSSGYREVAPFNDEPYADFWFEKPLAGAPAS